MEVQFTAEQEAKLSHIAAHYGLTAANLVKQAALQLLREDTRLEEGIQRRLEASERGDFADSAHVWANFENILRSSPQHPPADERNPFASYRGALPAFQTKEQINNWLADLRND